MNSKYTGELRVGDKVLPVKEWHISYDPANIDTSLIVFGQTEVHYEAELHGIEPGLSLFLEGILGDHEMREVEHGTYEHAFASVDWPFRMAGGTVHSAWTYLDSRTRALIQRITKQERRQERWQKIRRRQKRAAFRRMKRGLA